MTRINADWLQDKAVMRVFGLLQSSGYQAFAVGGCIRNTLMGFPVADIDFATDARPEQVIGLARAAKLRAVPTGAAYGTITVISGGTGFEVTTFRSDIRTDGRHAEVSFAPNAEIDAHRRDFTINALYAGSDGTVLDPLNGMADITERRVRFIDDAHQRIAEDYLRILRFFRFHAWFADPTHGIDRDALAACSALAEGLECLARERVGAEMVKLLSAMDPAPAMAAMAQTGILSRILPGAATQDLAVLVHHERAAGIEPDWRRRLALTGAENPEASLRLSKADRNQIRLFRDLVGDDAGIAEIAYRHSAATAQGVAVLRATLFGADVASDLLALTRAAVLQEFPVRATDLPAHLRGREIGRMLQKLEKEWIGSGFSASKSDLLS